MQVHYRQTRQYRVTIIRFNCGHDFLNGCYDLFVNSVLTKKKYITPHQIIYSETLYHLHSFHTVYASTDRQKQTII